MGLYWHWNNSDNPVGQTDNKALRISCVTSGSRPFWQQKEVLDGLAHKI